MNIIANELNWSTSAPRGGKTVMNRAIKEGAAVPLFLGQTVINSLRDMGYNSTTSALCELVDNSIQWQADEIRVYIDQSGIPGNYKTNIAVVDNGIGMAPNVLKVAMSFGGSLNYDNRDGIGRYGMGMKTAALSISPVLDVYSWQESGSFYNMTIDVEEIGLSGANLITLPEAEFVKTFPDSLLEILTQPMSFPRNVDDQTLFADPGDLVERLGASGTLVYLPECDRLSYAKAQTLVEDAMKEMGRVYRRFIAAGTRIYVNNRLVEAADPTYSMEESRHTLVEEIDQKLSRLIVAKTIPLPNANSTSKSDQSTSNIEVRLYALPIEEWSHLPMSVRKNKLRLYDGNFISFMRNDREVFAGHMARIQKPHGDLNWIRICVDFPGDLDEAFGVSANKQGVRPKGYILDTIKESINNEIQSLRDKIKRYQAEQSAEKQAVKSASLSKAQDAEALQAKPLEDFEPKNEKEEQDLNLNIKSLAKRLRKKSESDEAAEERVRKNKYFIEFKHDKYWPFYDIENVYGKIVLIINTAHPFYTELYEPLRDAALKVAGEKDLDPDSSSDEEIGEGTNGAVVALELLLLSMARTQALMAISNEERGKIFEQFRKEWSDNFRVQLEIN